MKDAFGVEHGDISKGFFKPAKGAAEFRTGGGYGRVRTYLTRHFPQTTKAGRNQTRKAKAANVAFREQRAARLKADAEASRRHDEFMRYYVPPRP